MYSLVSAPVLGFDLVRRPGGAETAAVLATALALGPADVEPLAAAPRQDVDRLGADRLRAWTRVSVATRDEGTVRTVADAGNATSDALGPGGVAADLHRRLVTAGIGTLEDLLRCVRHDILDWTWTGGPGVAVQPPAATVASGVVCDAVAAAYAGHLLSTIDRTVLTEPWRQVWATRTPPVGDVGPGAGEVRALLERVRTAEGARRRDLLAAADAYRAGTRPWSLAVHNASWAAHLSGRTRAAATAQMQAVLAVQRARFTAAECAAGVWNLVSGAVHAMVVADLLGDVDHLALTEPLEVLG
jgi:hypothetical protein